MNPKYEELVITDDMLEMTEAEFVAVLRAREPELLYVPGQEWRAVSSDELKLELRSDGTGGGFDGDENLRVDGEEVSFLDQKTREQ